MTILVHRKDRRQGVLLKITVILEKCGIKLLQRTLQFTLEKLPNFTREVCRVDASVFLWRKRHPNSDLGYIDYKSAVDGNAVTIGKAVGLLRIDHC